MNTSDRFLRFAAECKVMAKFSRTPETRAVWSGLAQRWVRCAELVDQQRIKRPPSPLCEAPSESIAYGPACHPQSSLGNF